MSPRTLYFTIMLYSYHLAANNDLKRSRQCTVLECRIAATPLCTTTDPPSTVSQGSAKGSRSIALYTVTSWPDQLYTSSNGELRRHFGGCHGHRIR